MSVRVVNDGQAATGLSPLAKCGVRKSESHSRKATNNTVHNINISHCIRWFFRDEIKSERRQTGGKVMPYSLEKKAAVVKNSVATKPERPFHLERPARKKRVQMTSARPTNPATASQWTGWTANSKPLTRPADMVTAIVAAQCSRTLVKWNQ